ncbi:MAG: dihydrodipicolinate synthase family protein [Alphaproteobacteria bacterium]|nr:dihydrodipicolinate synthase family protein [Alphaproteobacteria bacterium]MCB9796637.1 dihydrodipicolinate synthase family protein [Alphaproteobacteria bacterium]
MDLLVSNLIPFLPDGAPDAQTLAREILRLAAAGVDGFVPALGEVRTLSPADQLLVAQVSVESAGGLRCLPCAWSGDPRALHGLLTEIAELGVESIVVPPPPGERLSVEALRRWYSAAAEAVGLPLFATHHARASSPLSLELLTELYVEGCLAGLIDRSRDPARLERVAEALPRAVLATGDETITEAGQTWGLDGFVTELGALYPRLARGLLEGSEDAEPWRQALRSARHGGGLAVLKARLGLGCRSPVELPDPRAVAALPPPEADAAEALFG